MEKNHKKHKIKIRNKSYNQQQNTLEWVGKELELVLAPTYYNRPEHVDPNFGI